MAYLIKAPNIDNYAPVSSIFLAGGITGCSDWQKYVWDRLIDIPYLSVYNPRRDNFDLSDKIITQKQIIWEFEYLQKADTILFWFASETVQPITLLEFGRWTALDKKLFIGCSPDYCRRDDIIFQLGLIRPEYKLHNNLNELINEVKNYYANISSI